MWGCCPAGPRPQAPCGAPVHTTVTCRSQGHHHGRSLRWSQVRAGPLRICPLCKRSLGKQPYSEQARVSVFQSVQRQSVRSQACRHEALCRPERGLHFRNSQPTRPPGGGADAPLLKAPFVYGSAGRAIEPSQGDNTLTTHSPLSECSECSS